MPKSSENTSTTPFTRPLPTNASLENLRKQAKTLLKSVEASEPDALAELDGLSLRTRSSDSRRFLLSDAQFVIARRYGFTSWSKLKEHVDVVSRYSAWPNALKSADDSPLLVDRFISLACLNYANDHTSRREKARELFEANPSIAIENIYAAATVGDYVTVKKLLEKEPGLSRAQGGPHKWEPLLYASYSRLNSPRKEDSTLEVARILLAHGADPNAGFMWDGTYLFTALTGVFGEGERGPLHQPQHQYCEELARLLLQAGADPNDGQTLYNRMFTGGTSHLELLFEFGLGKRADGVWYKRLRDRLDSPEEMVRQQVAWAAKYNQWERMRFLVNHGVDLNGLDSRFQKAPYELALLSGNTEMAEFLLANGATKSNLTDLEAFTAACLRADSEQAEALLAKHPTLIDELGSIRAELLNLAAESNKPDAIRLMHELGFDLNERRRTVALHSAAMTGNLEMVRLLLELGADPLIRDEEFNATPLGWAEYGEQTSVADYLRKIEETQKD
jgi:ankyrin repeat protein